MPNNGQPVTVRIGIHSGPVTSGIVGYRMPKFCLFGDTMNTASRMETTCPHGCIQVSNATHALLSLGGHAGQLVSTGGVEVKGKGRMVSSASIQHTPSRLLFQPAAAVQQSMTTHMHRPLPLADTTLAHTNCDLHQSPFWLASCFKTSQGMLIKAQAVPCGVHDL
jgi:hypothetical protein